MAENNLRTAGRRRDAARLELPDEYGDDSHMSLMLSELPRRELNPDVYEAMMSFWQSTVRSVQLQRAAQRPSPRLVFSVPALQRDLTRKGIAPECLPQVLAAMIKEFDPPAVLLFEDAIGDALPSPQRARLSTRSSTSSFGLGSLVGGVVSFFSPQRPARPPQDVVDDASRFVLVDAVFEVAMEWLDALTQHAQQGVVPASVLALHPLVGGDEDTLQLLVACLVQNERALRIVDAESGVLKGIKLVQLHSPSSRSVAHVDHVVAQMLTVAHQIKTSIAKLEAVAASKRDEAKQALAAKNRRAALRCMAQRKSALQAADQRHASLVNIDTVLLKMDSMTADRLVVDSMSQAGRALEKLRTEFGLDAEHVEEVMEQLEDEMARVDEVSEALALSQDTQLDQEVEDELSALMEAIDLELPDAPQHEPVIRGREKEVEEEAEEEEDVAAPTARKLVYS